MSEKNRNTLWSFGDLIIPILAIMLGAYYLKTIRGIPNMAQMYGKYLSFSVFLLSAVLFSHAYRSGLFKKMPNLLQFLKTNVGKKYIKAIVLMVSVFILILLLPFLGYTATSLFYCIVTMYYLGLRNHVMVWSSSILITLIGVVLFIGILKVPLPIDPITQGLVQSVF